MYPSDAAMIRHFERNEATFDELLERMRLRPDITHLRRGVVFSRTDGHVTELGAEGELKALMRRLNLNAVSNGERSVYMEFVENSLAFDFADEYKGYAYLITPPNPNRLVEDLDALGHIGTASYVYFFRHLKGNWYLYLRGQH